jgi:cell division checkpoint GTPase YihA
MLAMMQESLHEGSAAAAAAEKTLRSAAFLLSAARLGQLPTDQRREVGFVGRSNSGKSSALNALTGRRALARVSKTPGRTQLLNLFDLTPDGRLVDLPGYGYARVPESQRRSWQALAGGYLRERSTLCGLVLLMDVRHPLRDLDWMLLEAVAGRPVLALLTKADKLGRGAAHKVLHAVRHELSERGAMQTTAQLFSATAGLGVDQARCWILSRLTEPGADGTTLAETDADDPGLVSRTEVE